jgi:hypothetical protein
MTRKKSQTSAPQWNWKSRQELARRLHDSYGDTNSPRRAFVLDPVRRDRYRAPTAELTTLGELTDDTDENCDVCFTYLVGTTPLLIVKLSLVGPYALVQEIGESANSAGRPRVIASAERESPAVVEALRILAQYGVLPLSEAMLAEPVDLRLPDVPNPTAYNALFAPEDNS